MRVSDFHFDLPPELVAQHPPPVRGSSRMLVVERQPPPSAPLLTDALFADLPHSLRPGDLLVLNDSRVLPSRLFATRARAATYPGSPAPPRPVEVLLTEQLSPEQASASGFAPGENLWRALCRPAKKVVPGERLLFFDLSAAPAAPPVLAAEVVGLGCFGERTLRFEPCGTGSANAESEFFSAVSRIGHMPLPPYIRRDQAQAAPPSEAEDQQRYQTVYARDPALTRPGSAAAPTAGLHFTPEILRALRARGVEIASVTLHVGLGTFQPVRVETLAEIRLHAERYTLPPETALALNRARAEGRRIIAVGTTTTRTLEHIAALAGAEPLAAHSGHTALFLSPGHRFRIVQGLLTNFHLPQSTLIMLVSALAAPPGDPDLGRRRVLEAYAHAIRKRYRFFSYGDCMLLL